jgi:hypothetical protein
MSLPGRGGMREETGQRRCCHWAGDLPPTDDSGERPKCPGRGGVNPTLTLANVFLRSGLLTQELNTPEIRSPLTDRLHDQGWTSTRNPVVPEIVPIFRDEQHQQRSGQDRLAIPSGHIPSHINHRCRLARSSNGTSLLSSLLSILICIIFSARDYIPQDFVTEGLKLQTGSKKKSPIRYCSSADGTGHVYHCREILPPINIHSIFPPLFTQHSSLQQPPHNAEPLPSTQNPPKSQPDQHNSKSI